MPGLVSSRESPSSQMRRRLLWRRSGRELIHSSLVPKVGGGAEGGRGMDVAQFGEADG
jgi:hypothetical protein